MAETLATKAPSTKMTSGSFIDQSLAMSLFAFLKSRQWKNTIAIIKASFLGLSQKTGAIIKLKVKNDGKSKGNPVKA